MEFLIRRKVFTLTGASFHIYKSDGTLLGFCRQKAFRLKEDIRVYKDEAQSHEVLRIAARSIIDFSAAYDVYQSSSDKKLGVLRRKGWTSMFRDTWEMLDADEASVGTIQEDSGLAAFLRRFLGLSWLMPQVFHLRDRNGEEWATFRTHFNLFVHKMTVSVEPEGPVSPFLVLAAGILLMAIEGRQN